MIRDLYGEILAEGAVVGSYAVEAPCSAGGFAVVYRARHLRDHTAVAIKVLREPLAARPRMVERFYREAAAIRRIRHSGVVDVLELGELDDGRPYLAMEWIEGRTLLEVLHARGPFSAHEALAVLVALGDAVAAAHRLGVIHRDIKAQNIMTVPRASAPPGGWPHEDWLHETWFDIKLIDFGIAKLIEPDDQHTALTTRTIMGTPGTMAPEQIRREPITPQTDIYALGVLLHQLITGKLPFGGANPVEVEQMHLYAPPPRASDLAPVSAAVDRVLLRALDKDPARRHPAVADLVADLREALRPGERGAPRPTVRPGIGVWVQIDATGSTEADLDLLGDALDHAHEVLAGAALAVQMTTADAILAGAALPEDETRARARRQAIIEVACDLYRWIRAHAANEAGPGERAPLAVGIAVYVAGVEVVDAVDAGSRGDVQLTGGDLMCLGTWPAGQVASGARSRPAGVWANSAALAGLAGEVPSWPMDGAAALRWLSPPGPERQDPGSGT